MSKPHRHHRRPESRDAEPEIASPVRAETPPAAPLWAQAAVRHGLWITLAVTFAARLIHWLSVRANDPMYAQTLSGFDMHTYWTWAQQIVEKSDWLSRGYTNNAPFYYGPLYPYFLAVLFKIAGVRFGAVHAAQAFIALAPPALLWDAARRTIGREAALATGLLTALCAPILLYEQVLLMEGLLVAIHAAVSWLLVRSVTGGERGRAWPWALSAGALSGIACWGRGNFLLVIPLFAAAYLLLPPPVAPGEKPAKTREPLRKRLAFSARRGALAAGALVLGASLTLGITLWRNHHVSGKAVLTTSNGPVLFYIGNASDATGVFAYPPSFDRLKAQYGSTDAVPWGRELARDVREHPGAFARVLGRKMWLYVNSYDIADNISYYANKRFSWLFRLSPVSWLTVLPMAAIGLWATRGRWRDHIFLYVHAAGFAVSIIVVFVTGRYRLEGLLAPLVWAGAALTAWLGDVRARRFERAAIQAVIVGAGVLLLWPAWSPAAKSNALPGMEGVPLVRPNDYNTVAIAYQKLGRTDEARDVLIEAVAEYPWFHSVVSRLATIYTKDRMPEKAIPILEHYLRLVGEDQRAMLQLAETRLIAGDAQGAKPLLERLLGADPNNTRVKELLELVRSKP